MIVSSTMAQLKVDDESLREDLTDCLAQTGRGEVISFPDFRKWQIPQDRRWGDLVFAAKEGTVLLPNHFQGRRRLAGMHGYAKSAQESSRPLALAWGEKWNLEGLAPEIPMRDLNRVILDLYGIEHEHREESKE